MDKNEQNVRQMWDITKCTDICKMGIPEGEDRKEQKK